MRPVELIWITILALSVKFAMLEAFRRHRQLLAWTAVQGYLMEIWIRPPVATVVLLGNTVRPRVHSVLYARLAQPIVTTTREPRVPAVLWGGFHRQT